MLILKLFVCFMVYDRYCTLDVSSGVTLKASPALLHQSVTKPSSTKALTVSLQKGFPDTFRRKMDEDIFYLGPKRSKYYNPNFGFEPYWMGGSWVFDRLDRTTAKPTNSICGNPCPEMYILFGTVCARNVLFQRKQFKNYCDLLNEDCTGRAKWMIMYRGDCKDHATYPTAHKKILARVSTWESIFYAINSITF